MNQHQALVEAERVLKKYKNLLLHSNKQEIEKVLALLKKAIEQKSPPD